MRIEYSYVSMGEVIAFALTTLRNLSPVGSVGDKHPGLYRDSHLIFINGHVVPDVSRWQPGQQINISNPEPYSRKVEAGKMKMSVPGHVYQFAQPIIQARYPNIDCQYVLMPVEFGSAQALSTFTKRQQTGHALNKKARRDWLIHQPALQITAR